MRDVTQESIRDYFDGELRRGRRLLPDPNTLVGLGSYLKYFQAAQLMAQPSVQRVLDIGCNHGSVEALFQLQFPKEAQTTTIDGIDISTEAIQHARQLQLPNCTFQSYDGHGLPYDDNAFDLVLMIEVIEHVVDKKRMLEEVNRVLRPSGRLLLTTPNPDCWPLRFEAWMWSVLRYLFRRPAVEKDVFVSHSMLESVLNSSGFRPFRSEPMYAQLRPFVQMMGCGLMPPMPPSLLYQYHKYCLTKLNSCNLPRFIDRHFKWSLIAEMHKAA
jgi:SAM-dependent methyltransferase